MNEFIYIDFYEPRDYIDILHYEKRDEIRWNKDEANMSVIGVYLKLKDIQNPEILNEVYAIFQYFSVDDGTDTDLESDNEE